jgi:3-hydroxy-5-methyl-1-naphthoate 3-O-methyltransferase
MILENLKSFPTTDPSDLIRSRDSIYATDLLITAISHFDLFTEINDKKFDFKGVCNHFKIDTRCADVMLTYFFALGLLMVDNGIFYLTINAKEFLLKTSQWSLLPYFATQAERPIVEKMANALKTGEPQSWGGKKDEPDWEKAMNNPDFAEMFTSGMDSRGAFFAPGLAKSFDFSKYDSILDIGGASGIYVASIAEHYPNMKAAVLEKSPVDKITLLSLSKRGIQNKIKILEGDMFKAIPSGYDIHLFSHVLHDWNLEHNSILIKNSYNSINKGGIIMVHDAHLNHDKTGPLTVAEYSVLLMFSTYGKCYSFTELELLMKSAGFVNIREISSVGNRSIIIGQKE